MVGESSDGFNLRVEHYKLAFTECEGQPDYGIDTGVKVTDADIADLIEQARAEVGLSERDDRYLPIFVATKLINKHEPQVAQAISADVQARGGGAEYKKGRWVVIGDDLPNAIKRVLARTA